MQGANWLVKETRPSALSPDPDGKEGYDFVAPENTAARSSSTAWTGPQHIITVSRVGCELALELLARMHEVPEVANSVEETLASICPEPSGGRCQQHYFF